MVLQSFVVVDAVVSYFRVYSFYLKIMCDYSICNVPWSIYNDSQHFELKSF
jgi:hypothetical protein